LVAASRKIPKRINNTPASVFNIPVGIIVPRSPMEAPRAVNIKEKPAIKLRVCNITCLRFGGLGLRTDVPAIVARYTGTRGKTQGDRNESIPAPQATGRVIFCSQILS
jgi:hypothetical protein